MRKYYLVVVCVLAVFAMVGFCDGTPSEGLHIIKGEYGVSDTWIDVTAQLRAMVHNNMIAIKASNEIGGDPIPEVPKLLKIEYILNGKKDTIYISEGSILCLGTEVPSFPIKYASNKAELLGLINECPADIGYYGINLSTGKTLEHQADRPACLASIVKVFVLLEVMRQNKEGVLDLSKKVEYEKSGTKISSTISEALDKMIGESDNEATSALASLVGYDNVNALPKTLGIDGLGETILPKPGVLPKMLDKRVFFKRSLSGADKLAQHGTARAIVKYFELLNDNKLIDENISKKVMEVLERNPKGFAASAVASSYKGLGKGGSIVWKRPFFKQYNMIGWGMLLEGEEASIAFCIWYEWFPEQMDEIERHSWSQGISDSIVRMLLE